MKDLAVLSHSLRRPSFSNTLAELPEVEEASEAHHKDKNGGYVEIIAMETVAKGNHSKLPTLHNEVPAPTSRPRRNTFPQTTSSHSQNANTRPKPRSLSIAPQPKDKANNVTARVDGKGEARFTRPRLSKGLITTGSFISSNYFPPAQLKWNKDGTIFFRRPSQIPTTPVVTFNIHPPSTDEPPANDTNLERQHSVDSIVSDSQDSDISEAILSKRRWSRPSFALTSRRVSLLLRSTNAMGANKKKEKSQEKTTPRVNIEEDLPKQARFSSYMSPEAQYALMKGYEDIIHEKLAKEYPEYTGLLKRNKTPVQKISIRRKSVTGKSGLDDAAEEDDDHEDDVHETMSNSGHSGEIQAQSPRLPIADAHKMTSLYVHNLGVPTTSHKTDSPILLSPTHQGHNTNTPAYLLKPHTSRSFDATSIISEPAKPSSTAALKNLRRLSISLEQRGDPSKLFEDQEEDEDSHVFTLQRYNSMPSMSSMPNDRRRALSYRLESAMDILDTLKGQGPMSLSPRVKSKPRRLAPLSEYNSWANDWCREFKVIQAKA